MNNIDTPEMLSDESLEAIRSALVEVQQDRQQTASFLEEMFDSMESMRLQIESHETTLRARRDQLGRREAQMRQTLEDLELRAMELASCEDELRDARVAIAEMESSITDLERERDEIRDRLDAAADELASVADVLAALDATQKELDETRQQLVEYKQQSKQHRHADNEEALRNAIREKQQLEEELLQSRNEICSLKERVRDQSDELANFRKRWSGGLENMRDKLMERAKDLKEKAVQPAPPSPPRRSRTPTVSSAEPENVPLHPKSNETNNKAEENTDSVIGSVLAQLADLADE
jgi:chromosome segregation ATPase